MLPEREKQQIVKLLMKEVQPAFIVLFGSYAKGTAREDSDVDLAYYSEEKLNGYNRFILAGNLAEICGTEVDVVNIRDVDTVFAMQIFEGGRPLAIMDANEYTKQKIKAYRMYATLMEQRQPIIESIQSRGSVYGDE